MIATRRISATPVTAERAPFVGRSGEVTALREHFAQGERLITLVGPPGVGKTRLALHFANTRTLPGGTVVVDLTHARTRVDLEQRLLAALGVPVGEESAESRVGDAVAARDELLLVLDNCEYLQSDARDVLDRLLDRAPLARLLATSLGRLDVEAELSFVVPPLPRDAAVALYEEEARRTDPDAVLERTLVEELVERLDRNALAIRLAAARVRTLRPRQLLSRIDQRLALLQGGRPGRHESLRHAIAHAWELLSPAEACALGQCAVFAGGFTLDAAEEVLDLSGVPGAPPIVELIDSLRSKLLLGATSDDPPRFTLLESIRAYALGELERTGDRDAACDRHADFYVRFADTGHGDRVPTERLQRLIPEEENLLAALRRMTPCDPVRATRIGLALEPLVLRHGSGGGAKHFEATVATARIAGDPALLSRALRALAVARISLTELQEARVALEEALDLAERAGEPLLACEARIQVAHSWAIGSAPETALEQLGLCVAEAREAGAAGLEGEAEHLRALACVALGRTHEAIAHDERATALFRRAGIQRREASATMHLGVCRSMLGEVVEARRLLEQALQLAREAGDRQSESNALMNLGNVALCEGRLDDAEQLLGGLRAVERELGRPHFEALAAGNLAVVRFERGDLRRARELIDDTLATFRASGNRRFLGSFGAVHGAVLAACGERERAQLAFADARDALVAVGEGEMLRMLEVLEGFLDLARARCADGDAAQFVEAARARAAEGLSGVPSSSRRIAVRLLEQAIDGGPCMAPPAPREHAPDRAALRVGPSAMWFELPGAPRVELRRRRTIRRVLHALVEQRLRAPGVGLTAEQLFEAGWPGERALPHSAAARVYDAVRILRQSGLEPILVRQDGGYLLDPDRHVRPAT